MFSKRIARAGLMLLMFAGVAQAQWQESGQTLNIPDINSDAEFGYSIDMGKKYAVVGAPGKTYTGKSVKGAVYVYEKKSNGKWERMDALPNPTAIHWGSDPLPDAIADDFGHSVALAEGTWIDQGDAEVYTGYPPFIVVGAPESNTTKDGLTYNSGLIAIYMLNSLTKKWEFKTYFSKPDYGNLGISVDADNWKGLNIFGNIEYNAKIVAGNPEDSSMAGSASFYYYDGTNWHKKTEIPALSSGDAFGSSVALCRENTVVTAPKRDQVDDDGITILQDVGAIYGYSSNGVLQVPEITHPGSVTKDYIGFGYAVDCSDNDFILVSEEHDPDNTRFAGAAYYLKKTASQNGGINDYEWQIFPKISAGSSIRSDDFFGKSLSLDNQNAVIGTPYKAYSPNTQILSGAFYTYYTLRSYTGWEPKEIFFGSNHSSRFGWALSAYQNELMAGEPGNNKVHIYTNNDFSFLSSVIMYLLN